MRVSESIFWQDSEQSILDIVSELDSKQKCETIHNLLHIVNWFDSDGSKKLDTVQSTTLKSMQVARQFLAIQGTSSRIDLASITLEEDCCIVPQGVDELLVLKRDATSIEGFEITRKLPLIFDLIDLADESQTLADYVIYTNSDICLQPNFYITVLDLLKLGFDSLIVNRRTIERKDEADFATLASADIGNSHPGLDCFIFPRKLIGKFIRNNDVTGAGQVNRGLFLNLVTQANSLLVLTEANLTYHYGDDRTWTSSQMKEYENHNKSEVKCTYNALLKNPAFNISWTLYSMCFQNIDLFDRTLACLVFRLSTRNKYKS